MLQYLVLVGAVASLIGIASYIKETVRGNNKPNRVSWLMWSIAPLIGTAAALASGVTWAVIPVFMSGFGPLLVFLSSFVNPNAYWKLERFDYLCGLFSLIGLILWGVTHTPSIAIIFAIASDCSAAIPTLVKSWNHPETETVAPFTTGLISALTSFAAIKIWNFPAYAFPIYLVIIDILLISAITHKKLKL